MVEILYGTRQVGVPGHRGAGALAARSRMCIRDRLALLSWSMTASCSARLLVRLSTTAAWESMMDAWASTLAVRASTVSRSQWTLLRREFTSAATCSHNSGLGVLTCEGGASMVSPSMPVGLFVIGPWSSRVRIYFGLGFSLVRPVLTVAGVVRELANCYGGRGLARAVVNSCSGGFWIMELLTKGKVLRGGNSIWGRTGGCPRASRCWGVGGEVADMHS